MSTILQISGMVAITAGVAWLSVPVALIVGGAFLIVAGLSVVK
jgi:hypothetical protein